MADNQYAITALARSEEARQREATRNVELQQRLEKMSIDLVVNAELVSTLQEEIVKMESLASKEFHTVAEEQKREEAVTKKNALAAAMLEDMCGLSSRIIDELQNLNKDVLVAVDKGSKEGQLEKQDVSDYAVTRLGLNEQELQRMEWLAHAALCATLTSGWRVTRGAEVSRRASQSRGAGDAASLSHRKAVASEPFVYLNDDDGRIERTHPVEQRCKKIRLNLMRWTGVRQQAESLFQSSLQMVPVTEDGDEEGEDEEHSGEEEQQP